MYLKDNPLTRHSAGFGGITSKNIIMKNQKLNEHAFAELFNFMLSIRDKIIKKEP